MTTKYCRTPECDTEAVSAIYFYGTLPGTGQYLPVCQTCENAANLVLNRIENPRAHTMSLEAVEELEQFGARTLPEG